MGTWAIGFILGSEYYSLPRPLPGEAGPLPTITSLDTGQATVLGVVKGQMRPFSAKEEPFLHGAL